MVDHVERALLEVARSSLHALGQRNRGLDTPCKIMTGIGAVPTFNDTAKANIEIIPRALAAICKPSSSLAMS